ncbi:uncharacterized protein LOC130051692 [Ostrea edulis]|uniref:uncharacterized protein LOC125661297 n=1 Tax=Ostrea edulis TaxID=37623 RepID=UPI002095659A|nr:uncharacterized protein LOC125661297 [Ostrea edulis]XP_056009285.1 uncharacterized protein LOC130051402 [Ostrea edulis]XP_056010084.1 uncharacterized protein LOC130051692 [Ostrea edulis]
MAAPTIDNIVEELLPDFGVNALKPEQKEIISNITKKKDCIAVLPTGFGKSLPFQVYAAAQKRTSREAGHVLVCSPLIGLMKDQTKKLSRISYLSVGYKGNTHDTTKCIVSASKASSMSQYRFDQLLLLEMKTRTDNKYYINYISCVVWTARLVWPQPFYLFIYTFGRRRFREYTIAPTILKPIADWSMQKFNLR